MRKCRREQHDFFVAIERKKNKMPFYFASHLGICKKYSKIVVAKWHFEYAAIESERELNACSHLSLWFAGLATFFITLLS